MKEKNIQQATTPPSPTTARILTGIYLTLVISSAAVVLLAPKGDSLAEKYLVMLSVPWSLLLKLVTGTLNTWLMVAGSFINGYIVYKIAYSLLNSTTFNTSKEKG